MYLPREAAEVIGRRAVRSALALIAALCCLANPVLAAKKVAFVVGIDVYDNLAREKRLQRAVNDARAMGNALTALGFAVTQGENLSRAEFNARWQKFLDGISEGDVAAIYFSGHGIEIEGLNYLLPRDVPYVTFGRQEQVKRESLSVAEFLLDLRKRRPQVTLVILDACRDNPLIPPEYRSAATPAGGLARMEASEGTFIMYSAGAGETALDRLPKNDPDAVNSVYTRTLLPLLGRQGLSLPELAWQVRSGVSALAATVPHVQRPAYYDGVIGKFCLAGCATETKEPPKPPAAPPPPPISEAERTWAWLKNTTDQSMVENFIKQFGDTPFGDEAKARLAELKKQQVAIAAPPKAPAPAPPKPVQPAEIVPPVSNLGRCDDGVAEWFAGSPPVRRCLKPKDIFKDCETCPEMVVIPAGAFTMGSPANEEGSSADESPQRKVTIAKPFAVGKFEATFAEWDACVSDRSCKHKPKDEGWGRGKRPVINVSWDDISKGYLPWLSRKTGKPYRLLTEAEWEYAVRAGSQAKYTWGEDLGKSRANCDECGSQWDKQTAPVGSFQANAFGLHDMHGNVWEWVADCYIDSYANAPSDGKAASEVAGCRRIQRGGSWYGVTRHLRAASRAYDTPGSRSPTNGFRLARTLGP